MARSRSLNASPSIRLLLLLSLVTFSAQAATHVEASLSRLDGSYPWRRIAEGTPTLAYSTVTALGGLWIMLDSRHHNDAERTVGALSAVTGGIMFLDSLALTFGKSSGEHFLDHYREMPASGDGLFPSREAYAQAALARFSHTSRSSRLVRGALALANAAPYFYFYFSNSVRYRNAVFLGSGLVAIGLYRFLIPSPEERAASILIGASPVTPNSVALRWSF